MAADKQSEAYDLTLFEPAEKKSAKKEKKPQKRMTESNLIRLHPGAITKVHRRKRNPIKIIGIGLLTIVVAMVCATIVQSNVVLNELNEEIIEANKTITQQNNLQAQYQLKVDSRLSASVVQDYAEKKLGMTQANNAQKKFISLSDGDYGKVIRDDGTNNALQTVANAFKGMWS